VLGEGVPHPGWQSWTGKCQSSN